MIRITCTNCHKPLSLDESKLPPREVSFPCPACKAKITVDGREVQGGAAPAEAPAAAQHEDHENEFGEKALIVGADDPALRHAAKLIGFLPIHQAEAPRAREFYMQEFPPVVILHPAQVTPPPLEAMGAMVSLVPADRRKSFFILVADGLRTLDGNAAFLYGVNLVVAKKDLPQFPQIYREAHTAHERFYASMNAVIREKQGA
jgi:hypothetical protein